jgi:hypothetical protein
MYAQREILDFFGRKEVVTDGSLMVKSLDSVVFEWLNLLYGAVDLV